VQRNATARPAATTAAPFARRDTRDTGRSEAVRDTRADARPDPAHLDKAGTGPTPTASDTRYDRSDVRPPDTTGSPTGTGSATGSDQPDSGTRTDRP